MKAINIPFKFSNGGVFETSELSQITENKIVDALITSNSERAINASYGVGLKTLLYEPLDSLVFDDFKSDAIVKINETLDSGKVLDITITYPHSPQMAYLEDSSILVTVVYSLPSTGSIRTFTFNVSSDI